MTASDVAGQVDLLFSKPFDVRKMMPKLREALTASQPSSAA